MTHNKPQIITQPLLYLYYEGCVIICGYLWGTRYVQVDGNRHRVTGWSLSINAFSVQSMEKTPNENRLNSVKAYVKTTKKYGMG